jgi:hypothetical protein
MRKSFLAVALLLATVSARAEQLLPTDVGRSFRLTLTAQIA